MGVVGAMGGLANGLIGSLVERWLTEGGMTQVVQKNLKGYT